jgi:hypothetical protein
MAPLFVSVALAQPVQLLDQESAFVEKRFCGERPCQGPIFASDVESEPDSLLLPTVITPGEIAAMAPGAWLQYGRPCTDAAPNPVPCGKPFRNILNAWNGWVRDGLRYAYVAASGGHTDGCDNGVYRYDIQTGSVELYVPHADYNADLDTGAPIVVDGSGVQIRPRTSHTYSGQFLRGEWLYMIPGSKYKSGSRDEQVWRFNVRTKVFERLPDRGRVGNIAPFLLGTPSGAVFMGNWDLCNVDLDAGTYDCQKTHNFHPNSGVAWDPVRNGFWHIDPKNGLVRFFSRNARGTWSQDSALSGVIPSLIQSDLGAGPGICVIPDGSILVWANSNRLHRWDGAIWTTMAPPGPPPVKGRRVYNKWSWDEQSKTCIGTASVDQGLWVYKPVIKL